MPVTADLSYPCAVAAVDQLLNTSGQSDKPLGRCKHVEFALAAHLLIAFHPK